MFGHTRMSFWPPLPAPGTGGIVSQDTLLNPDTVLSIVGGGGGGTVPANLLASTLTVNATGYVSTLALNGVSSINGTGVAAFTGAVPSNLLVSTLGVNPSGSISTPSITVTGDVASIGGGRAITLGYNIGNDGDSVQVLFNDITANSPQTGQLSIKKFGVLTALGRAGYTSGLAVSAYSTVIGAFQPVGCGDLFLYSKENDGTNYAYTLEAKNTPVSSLNIQAPAVNISSLIGVSSINGINWAAISTLIG